MGRTSDARERLVQAAIDLIWPTSYGSVGVDAICEAAGVKKGSFYHFFATKEELVVEALQVHFETRRPVLDGIFSPSRPPLERLRRYFEHPSARQSQIRAQYGRILGCFHNSIGTECIQKSPIIAAKVQEVLSMYVRYIESALRDAKAQGLLPAGVDPAADAKTVFAYVQGALTQARINDDLEILRRLPETGFALLGLSPNSGAPAKPTRKSLRP
jgi:TetR/AcrR family transcriptional regulator, transcriptional repressor for nem operon